MKFAVRLTSPQISLCDSAARQKISCAANSIREREIGTLGEELACL